MQQNKDVSRENNGRLEEKRGRKTTLKGSMSYPIDSKETYNS